MPRFGRLSLDSYRAGPMSATEALGHNRTFTAGDYALPGRMLCDRSLTTFPNPSHPNGLRRFGALRLSEALGHVGALIVHREFILPHSRLPPRLSDSPR